ncbi:unnamed protein product [Arctogadus glacialis]
MAFGHLVPQLKLEEATEDGLFRNISTLHPSQHAPNQRGKTVSPYNTRKQQNNYTQSAWLQWMAEVTPMALTALLTFDLPLGAFTSTLLEQRKAAEHVWFIGR